MALAPGEELGHYRILAQIGAGGMGEVYLAQDGKLGRLVAIKLLPAQFTADPDRVRRFEQEAKSASALNHPNIITIHEIGESAGSHYIATEYIEGETLRQHFTGKSISIKSIVDIAVQIASALSAAHKAGIIHRDVKPENVMLRPDGYAKILDFGLVKLAERHAITVGSETPTVADTTEPGKVLGTVRYMSPEQVRGKGVDARTDVFSLGVVLYEMVTGQTPFSGESMGDVFAAILHDEPQPLTNFSSEVPDELQDIVSKSLQKDRDQRYQTMSEMLAELKSLQEELQVQSRLESVTGSGLRGTRGQRKTGRLLTAQQTQTTVASPVEGVATRTLSITESLWIRKRNRIAIVAIALVAVLAIAAIVYLKNKPVLTEQDTILLADFENTTGDSIFDGTLKQGLAVQLGQSPFLNITPDVRVRQTLRLMGRSPDERVTADIGREICERQGLKAVIAGAIAPLGSHYVITLQAVIGRTGDIVASEQAEAESKEQVLKALSKSASRLREKLGESLGSIQKFDAPLEVTTSSLEALKAFSLGLEQTQSGKFLEAIPFYKHAIELDPNFAYAYGTLAVNYYNTRQPRLAAQYAETAFNLRDRMSELEKLRITSFYFAFVTGEIEKGIEAAILYKQTYPRDERGPLNLSDRYGMIGQWEKSVDEAQRAISLNPNNAVAYWNLADALTHLDRFSDAKEICNQAIQQKLDTLALHYFLYEIGFAEGDSPAMDQQLAWASGRLDEYAALDWQNGRAAFEGQWKRAEEFSRRSIDLAERDAREVAARYAAEAALRAAAIDRMDAARASAARSLSLERNQISLTRTALALALCGETTQANALLEEIARRFPKDTLINGLWIPVVKAGIELNRRNYPQAIQLLEGPRRYEPAAEFWPQYLRGLAYLNSGSGSQAAAEFQRIIEHRGEAPLSVLYPLARSGMARALASSGANQKSTEEYKKFLLLWHEADSDLTALTQARQAISSGQ